MEKTPYLELEHLRDNIITKTRMYSYDEIELIIKEWDEQAKSKIDDLENQYQELIKKRGKRIVELKTQLNEVQKR